MATTPRTLAEIREDLIAARAVADDEVDTSEGGDAYIDSNAIAGIAAELQARDVELSRAILPSTATGTDLDEHATVWLGEDDGRQAPTQWFGTITLTREGAATPIVAIGTVLVHADGTEYETTTAAAAADWTASTFTVNAQSVDENVGTTGNKAVDTPLTVQAPPAGLSSSAVIASTTTAAVDEETDDALRSRIYVITAGRPGAGNAADYEAWAESVSGVSKAFTYPRWEGIGTVWVVPLQATGNHIIPAGTLLTAVQTEIDAERPCGCVATVEAATASPLTINAAIYLQSGYETDWAGTRTTAATANHSLTRVYITATAVGTINVGSYIVVPIGTNDFSCCRLVTNVQTSGATHYIDVSSAFVDEDGTETEPDAAGGKTIRPGSLNHVELMAAIKGVFDNVGPSSSASPVTAERYPGPQLSHSPNVYRSDLFHAIEGVDGVVHCTISAPAVDQTNTVAIGAAISMITFDPAVILGWASL